MRRLMIPALAFVTSTATALAQDVTAGERLFRTCSPCHSVGEGATNKLGPALNGLDGRKAGTVEGYDYSDALKSSGITWNEASFKEYVQNPTAKVPGTKMIAGGPRNDKDIADLWAYLKQFGPDGKVK